ncbi:MAG: toprim domain-containing protein [Geminicoccaceae bacterium]
MTIRTEVITGPLRTIRTACPACNKGPYDTALAITSKGCGGFVWFCHRCGMRGAARGDIKGGLTSHRQSKSHDPLSEPSRQKRRMDKIWRKSLPIGPKCIAARYLQARGCILPPDDSDLRWHPRLFHPSDWYGPALVGRVTHAVSGEPMTLHRTWLAPDGNGKAPVKPTRLMFKGLPKRQGVIRLWPEENVTEGLAIAEGIETALTVALGFVPVWACIDAGNLAVMPVLKGVESLTVAVDNDHAGHKAYDEVSNSWKAAGREIRRWISDRSGMDLNDHYGRGMSDEPQ